jgi:hypothetical protein
MGLLNLLDITAGINKGIEGAMQAGWKPMRNFYEGLRGTTKYKDAEGEIVSMSPAQKLARRLKNDTKQMFTGNRYDMKNNLVEEELGVGGRIGMPLQVVFILSETPRLVQPEPHWDGRLVWQARAYGGVQRPCIE